MPDKPGAIVANTGWPHEPVAHEIEKLVDDYEGLYDSECDVVVVLVPIGRGEQVAGVLASTFAKMAWSEGSEDPLITSDGVEHRPPGFTGLMPSDWAQ